MKNPWEGGKVEVSSKGGKKLTFEGEFIKMSTEPGTVYVFRPMI
jgi:hypothetical protein